MDAEAIDRSVPNAARIYDFLLGGSNHFAIDRQAAEMAFAGIEGGLAGAQEQIQQNRLYLGRVVEWLVREAGVRQFLDIGSGIPNDDNVHAVAQTIAPETRVVYVDNDPSVLAHADELLVADGPTTFVDGDFRRPTEILRQARQLLDFDQPIAVLLIAVLHFVEDGSAPFDIVRDLVDALPPGSYLAISHVSENGVPGYAPERVRETVRILNERTGQPMVPRDVEVVQRFFDGLDMVDPGLVPLHEWHPGGADLAILPNIGGVAHKP
jgi:SAM-dependent methyltransferase